MSVKQMLKDIEELKGYIKNFDEDFDKTVDTLTNQELEITVLDKKIYDFELIQNNTVTFNISGKLVEVNRLLFTDCNCQNILQQEYLKYERNLEELKNKNIEFEYNHFQIFLDLLRKKSKQPSYNFEETGNIVDYFLPKKTEPEVFHSDLLTFFLNDLSKICSSFNIKYYYKSNVFKKISMTNALTDHITSETVSKVFQDNNLKNFVAKNFAEILTINSKVAFFIEPKGTITFTLNKNISASIIELKPFVLDPTTWYPGDGAGSKILVLTPKEVWKTVGKVPGNYGSEVDVNAIYKIKFNKTQEFKKIKIQAGLFGLSISYLNLC